MKLLNIHILYPLQVDPSAFAFGGETNPRQVLIFLGVLIAIIAILVFFNSLKSKPAGKKGRSVSASQSASSGLFSSFALRRFAKSIGLDSDQTKMFTFVLKADNALEPEKSVSNPVLLDRHFRKAYRIIEQSSGSDEDVQNKLSLLFSTRNVLENTPIGGLASSHKLKDTTQLIISSDKEKHEVSILSNRTDALAVESPLNALGSIKKMDKGTKITVMFFSKNNKSYIFETRVIGYSTVHGQKALLLAHSNQIKLLAQRRFRRRATAFQCSVFLVNVEGKGKNQKLVVDKRALSGNITDISMGGCSIKMKAPVPVGAKIKIEFSNGINNLAALGQVLRTNRMGMISILHIRFLKVSRKSMNQINAFVYEYVNS